MCLKVMWVKLQLLFDPVLHQKAEIGVCHWKAITHVYLLIGLLCCKTKQTRFTLAWFLHKIVCYSVK